METHARKFKIRAKMLFILLFPILLPLILNLPLQFFSNGPNDKFNYDIDSPQSPPLSSGNPIGANYFSFYKNITIDHTKVAGSGSHTDFPFLLSLIDSDLHDDVQPDGNDIAFAMGGLWLDHEIELFNPTYSATEAHLIAWIRIPSLSTSVDTVISIYYGNSTMNSRQNPISVWNNDYKAIWHMSDNPSGTIYDSTSNDNDGTTFGGMDSSDQVSSKIGGGISLDGINDYILIPHSSSIDITGNQITLEAWINLGQVPPQHDAPVIVKAPSDNNERYMLGVDGGENPSLVNQRITASISGYRRYDVGRLYQDTWTHISAVYDGTLDGSNKFFVYIDGALISAQYAAGTILSTSGNLNIGRRISTSRWLYGIIDELRISSVARSDDWFTTQFNNHNDPFNFYSVGSEQAIFHQAQIYAVDLYGNVVPNANISMYKNTNLVQSGVTTSDGSVLFTNITQAEYNFTVKITSDIGNHSEIVNKTTILIDNNALQIIYLECNVSTNLFTIIDVDGAPVGSGWVLVGNSTDIIQKCLVDNNGKAIFQWLNTTPYQYNYSVYYQDDNFNPNIIKLGSGGITTPNSSILVQSYLTTVNFTIFSYSTVEAVSGAKIKLRINNTSGLSIVNLTTDQNGSVTLRWLNSTGISGNYSLQIEFFGENKDFNTTAGGIPIVDDISFSVKNKIAYDFRISLNLLNFETELISLNPTDSIAIEWGSRLKLRTLFNVTKAIGFEGLLGPIDADLMLYKVSLGGIPISSGEILKEEINEGRHSTFIETTGFESDTSYLIRISAQKSGYTIPSDLILQLNIFRNNLELNQSENDESIQSVYWADNINMSVKPYGKKSETITVKNNIFKNINNEFEFSIPDIDHGWNLSEITFNIYNISWNVGAPDINITILDPYGSFYIFHPGNHPGWDFLLEQWTGITLNLDKKSPLNNNNFKYTIGGTFDNTVDIIAEALLIRDSINIQYSKFNVTNEIVVLTENEGWAIKNITFEVLNCLEMSTWDPANLTILSNLNISTSEGSKYSLDFGDANGLGILIIDDQIINPLNDQFLFVIESYTNITFDVKIKVEYIQEFYKSLHLETFTVSKVKENIINGGIFEIGISEIGWVEVQESATLWVRGINNGSADFLPSDVGMNMTIGGIPYTISDAALGEGTVSLLSFNKNEIFQAFIETAQSVNFTLSYTITYSRQIFYEVEGSVSYLIQEKPTISGNVQYYDTLRYYIQTIDTSLIDAAEYTITFRIYKDHYVSASKDLKLIVLNRLTLINGETTLYRSLENIYINDAINFTFFYTDAITGENITNIKISLFIWEKYDTKGNVIDSGQGTLNVKADNSYILDLTTENKTTGEYLLIATLEKDNYEYKNAMILLTINKREVDYILGNNFRNKQSSAVQGNFIPIIISLTDPTKGDIPLINATIFLTIGGVEYEIEGLGDGTYRFDYQTSNINAFFTSTTLRGVINISKEDYISEEFSIIIVVEMQEIFPGIPAFYFLLIISAVIAFTASIVGYRVYKYAKVPTFVKRVRAMKKAIEGDNSISESLLYRTKNAFIAERVKDKWKYIELSLENVLGIKSIKEKKGSKIKRRISETVDRRNIKPIGLILMKWDERIGTEIMAKHPEEATVSEKTLMQIYGTHEYSSDKGIITLTSGSLNIISYYTGPEKGYYLVLLLNIDDDPDVYEGGMADILRVLLDNIDDGTYIQLMPSLFQRLSIYPSLSDEEILSLSYHDEMKRMIIENLRDVGAITKSELMIWLKDKYVEGFFDIEATLLELLKRDIVKLVSVKGIPSELIFLTNDFFMLRVPPVKLLENPVSRGLPTQFVKEYRAEIKKFFQNYRPTAEDNLRIIELLIKPQAYETVRLLRTSIVTLQDLEKLKKKGVVDANIILQLLWNNQMVRVFIDKNNIKYYALLTDFYMDLIFPKYLLTVIKTAYEQKSQPNKVLIEYLKSLEDTYFDLKSQEKS
ncbi:hypothetical protein LCGC14_0679240 [marine sediment metagenome]|uniref:LamG-like jellyroll fold domain-containing protein n=1 Tax=marine sediment metagenome TaxID=412755 RepID=A0A0F9QTT7_9ZZZZ